MPAKKQDYTQLQQQLDEAINALQGADLDIDEATKYYETGMKLIAQLETHIKDAENKVAKIKVNFKRQKSAE